VPCLDCSIVTNEENETVTIFAINKDLEENIEVTCDLRQFIDYQINKHIVLEHSDLKAENTEQNPNNVVPHNNGNSIFSNGILTLNLNKHSWNVITLSKC
jgi:alpha-N-arabinofuranosidase